MNQREASRTVGAYFQSWYSFVVRYAWRCTGNLETAEDLVQEVFLRLYQELRKGATIRQPKAWTLAVLRHEIGRQARAPGSHWESLDNLDEPPAAPVEGAGEAPEIDELTELFAVLSKREEETILLRMAGMKYAEIAAELGFSPNAVGTLLTRALRKLKDAAKKKREGHLGATHGKLNALKALQ